MNKRFKKYYHHLYTLYTLHYWCWLTVVIFKFKKLHKGSGDAGTLSNNDETWHNMISFILLLKICVTRYSFPLLRALKYITSYIKIHTEKITLVLISHWNTVFGYIKHIYMNTPTYRSMSTKQILIIFYTLMKSLAWNETHFWSCCSWTQIRKLRRKREDRDFSDMQRFSSGAVFSSLHCVFSYCWKMVVSF